MQIEFFKKFDFVCEFNDLSINWILKDNICTFDYVVGNQQQIDTIVIKMDSTEILRTTHGVCYNVGDRFTLSLQLDAELLW